MPVRAESPRSTFEQFAAIHRYQPTLAFSPDGAHIAYVSNASGQFNLWRQATDGGEPVQLTDDDEHAVRQVAWSPDGATLGDDLGLCRIDQWQKRLRIIRDLTALSTTRWRRTTIGACGDTGASRDGDDEAGRSPRPARGTHKP